MAPWVVKLCLITLFVSFSNSLPRNSSLRYVQIVLRHGARTPLTYFDDDPNNVFWEDKPGKLTKVTLLFNECTSYIKKGKQDTYLLGKWFRRRYEDFLSDYRDDDETILRSTDKDRTLATAQLFGAGLYPPKGREIWNDDLGTNWQPTPVHTLPVDQDPFADDFPLNFCPRYNQLGSTLLKTPELSRYYNESKPIIDLINSKIRKEKKYEDDIWSFVNGGDTLIIEQIFNLTLPEWIAGNMTKVQKGVEYFTFNYVKTSDLIRLSGGKLAKHIFDNMQNVIMNPNTTKEKVRVFAAHDYTIIFLLSAMRMFNFVMPPFSAAVIIELHENAKGQYFVEVFYKNSTLTENVHVFQFPDCGSDTCPFQTALDSVKDLFMSNVSAECTLLTADELNRKEQELMKQYV